MLIFLRNIPPETKKYELASCINRVINNSSLFSQVANILTEEIEILLIQYAIQIHLKRMGCLVFHR